MMKTPGEKVFNTVILTRMLVISLCLSGMAIFTAAQRNLDLRRLSGKTEATTDVFAPAAPPNIDQCANGKQADGPPVACAGAAWQNGNLNENNSQWVEGQAVPYRIVWTDLTPGSTGNTVTIQWDTTEGDKHALDYIMTYNYTNTGAVPCDTFTFCAAAPSTAAIPMDSRIPAGIQIGGQLFYMWGATITGISAYTYTGPADYSSTTTSSLTITFDAGSTANAVLAWSGHISTRIDWGVAHSAIALPGSPYHMRLHGGTGQQDRSMSVAGIIYPGSVTIIKEVQSFDGGNSFTTYFPYTATNFSPTSFSLRDVNNTTEDRVSNSITLFGAGNTITVTESLVTGWSLQPDSACVETSGGLPNTVNSSLSFGTRTATIIVEEGESVVCTFKNLQTIPTAANAVITGRVMDANGYGILGARLTITNLATGETKSAVSNNFGNYVLEDLPVSDFYILTVNHRKFSFNVSTRSFTLNDNLEGVDFMASW
jgi:hypothetical protein